MEDVFGDGKESGAHSWATSGSRRENLEAAGTLQLRGPCSTYYPHTLWASSPFLEGCSSFRLHRDFNVQE